MSMLVDIIQWLPHDMLINRIHRLAPEIPKQTDEQSENPSESDRMSQN